MHKHFTPTPQQQQIIQTLLNTEDKGKHFYQIYSNIVQRHIAINAFSLLTDDQMSTVTNSIMSLQTNNTFTQQQTQKINQCYKQCQKIQSSSWTIHNQRKQRNCNSICMLMCLGIMVTCIFNLWEMIFITSSSDIIDVNQFQPVSVGNFTTLVPQKQTNFVYLTQKIVYIGLKMVSGFWTVFGCLFSSFCFCGCVPNFYKSVRNEYRQRRCFKQRIMKNRECIKTQQIKNQ